MSPPFRQSYAALNAQPHEAELIERLKAEAAREFAKYPERDRPDLIRAYVRTKLSLERGKPNLPARLDRIAEARRAAA